MSGGESGSGIKKQLFPHFSKIKLELDQKMQVTVWRVCEMCQLTKHEADEAIEAYFKKYEQKCKGVYVVTSIRENKISTKLEQNISLVLDTSQTVLSSYLVGLLSLNHQNERLLYSDFAYPREVKPQSSLITTESTQNHHSHLLKTSLEDNQQTGKRPVGPADHPEEDELKKQTTKVKPDGDAYAGTGENRAASSQQKKPSLLSFFKKK